MNRCFGFSWICSRPGGSGSEWRVVVAGAGSSQRVLRRSAATLVALVAATLATGRGRGGPRVLLAALTAARARATAVAAATRVALAAAARRTRHLGGGVLQRGADLVDVDLEHG